MQISAEELYARLGQLVQEMPRWDLSLTSDDQQWLGRATALVDACGTSFDILAFKAAVQGLYTGAPLYRANTQKITAILYFELARAELNAPVSAKGTFIPVGSPHVAIAAVCNVVAKATIGVLFVDPYADSNLVNEFAAQVPEGVEIRILADQEGVKPGLKPTLDRWNKQYPRRKLQARLSAPKQLHDRMIIVDDGSVFAIGQSFNALATRSPTSIVRTDDELAAMKVLAYKDIWERAEQL